MPNKVVVNSKGELFQKISSFFEKAMLINKTQQEGRCSVVLEFVGVKMDILEGEVQDLLDNLTEIAQNSGIFISKTDIPENYLRLDAII